MTPAPISLSLLDETHQRVSLNEDTEELTMITRTLCSLTILAAAHLGTAGCADAQCAPFRPPCGGSRIQCATPPVIGTNLDVCLAPSCNTNANMMLIGTCHGPGIPLGAPPLCGFCSTCRLHVLPVANLPWVGTTGSCLTLPIPNDTALVGASLCMQNVCFLPPPSNCICLSNTLRVTFM